MHSLFSRAIPSSDGEKQKRRRTTVQVGQMTSEVNRPNLFESQNYSHMKLLKIVKENIQTEWAYLP
jgi:hypothetical protein